MLIKKGALVGTFYLYQLIKIHVTNNLSIQPCIQVHIIRAEDDSFPKYQSQFISHTLSSFLSICFWIQYRHWMVQSTISIHKHEPSTTAAAAAVAEAAAILL
jgi:hypothetical protein